MSDTERVFLPGFGLLLHCADILRARAETASKVVSGSIMRIPLTCQVR